VQYAPKNSSSSTTSETKKRKTFGKKDKKDSGNKNLLSVSDDDSDPDIIISTDVMNDLPDSDIMDEIEKNNYFYAKFSRFILVWWSIKLKLMNLHMIFYFIHYEFLHFKHFSYAHSMYMVLLLYQHNNYNRI